MRGYTHALHEMTDERYRFLRTAPVSASSWTLLYRMIPSSSRSADLNDAYAGTRIQSNKVS